jgi:hypothetical protein
MRQVEDHVSDPHNTDTDTHTYDGARATDAEPGHSFLGRKPVVLHYIETYQSCCLAKTRDTLHSYQRMRP